MTLDLQSTAALTRARGSRRSPRTSRLAFAVSLAVVALLASGCGASSSSTTTTHASTTHAATSTHASTAAGAGLAGKWSGQYSGAYSGTFTLNWTKSGSNLNGKIQLSDPPETTGITGSVSGNSIKFGTVGGAVYNGTLSGDSMSGNYQTPNGGGSWSANKA